MPWTYDDPPAVAQGWTEAEQRRCVDAANAVLEDGGSDQEAIYACIAAAGKGQERRRVIVAGAPCSGKSTWVRRSAQVGDLIYDYDTLHQALSGQPSHRHLDAIRPYVLTARDAILADLEAHEDQPAWVITSTHRAEELRTLAERLGAEVVLLSVERDEAHARCDGDGRPDEWHTYIDNWFDRTDIDPAAEWITQKGKGDEAMERKTYTGGMTLKADGEEGEFSAVFSTLNVIDHQEDVTMPGAFTEGEPVRIAAWNHGWDQLPVGKGEIREEEDSAVVEGRFFLNTQTGREHYETVKALGALQEWSYSFDILDASFGEFEGKQVRFLRKLKVHEVSPVMLGAGIGTHTRAIKSDGDRGPTDGKGGNATPSGPVPSVVRAQVEIALLEE